MKIQIDTKNKTIKLEEGANLGDFLTEIKKFFPKGEWRKYKLEISTTINSWYNPIIIKRDYHPYVGYPWYHYTHIDYNNTGGVDYNTQVLSLSTAAKDIGGDLGLAQVQSSATLQEGTYNIELFPETETVSS